jgi:hypothetical protein
MALERACIAGPRLDRLHRIVLLQRELAGHMHDHADLLRVAGAGGVGIESHRKLLERPSPGAAGDSLCIG